VSAAAGHVLHHESTGPADGAPIVLLHGLGSCGSDWGLQLPALADRHRVITFDLPGHGRSPLPSGPVTIAAMAHDVAEVLRRLTLGPVHLVGLSLGGCVALALAAGFPEDVRTLTLVNTFAKLRPAGARGVGRMLKRVALLTVAPIPVMAASVARDLFPLPDQEHLYRAAVESLGRTSRRSYAASMRALARVDLREELASIRCPTLVIAGARDPTVPLAAKELLARRIPGARLLVIPESRHATNIDQPEAFNRAVLEFVETAICP